MGNQKDKVYDRGVVEWWHKALQNVVLTCHDFETIVREGASSGSFIFMDPPYRNSFTQYNTDFNDSEQERVIECLKHCKDVGAVGWLSNRDGDDSFFENRWSPEDIKYFDVTYTAGRRKKTDEGYEAKPAREVLLVTGEG